MKLFTMNQQKLIVTENSRVFSCLCKLAYSTRNLEIRFQPNSSLVTLDNETSITSLTKWRYILLGVFLTSYFLQRVFTKDESQLESFIAWVFLIMLLLGSSYVVEVRRKAMEIRDCINMLYELDLILPGKHGATQTSLLLKIYVLFIYTAFGAAFVLPIIPAHGLHWINPCKSTLAGYWMIRGCLSKSKQPGLDILVQSGVILLNQGVWSFVVNATIFGASVIHILAVAAIQQLIQRYDNTF